MPANRIAADTEPKGAPCSSDAATGSWFRGRRCQGEAVAAAERWQGPRSEAAELAVGHGWGPAIAGHNGHRAKQAAPGCRQNRRMPVIMARSGELAQLVERCNRTAEVRGSSPLFSIPLRDSPGRRGTASPGHRVETGPPARPRGCGSARTGARFRRLSNHRSRLPEALIRTSQQSLASDSWQQLRCKPLLSAHFSTPTAPHPGSRELDDRSGTATERRALLCAAGGAAQDRETGR